MQYDRFIPGLVALALVGFVLLLGPESGCGESYRNDKIISLERKNIRVEVAEEPKEQAIGLSGRKCIGDKQGMLFVFNEPGYYNFWMKDMEFPIDIVWIDNDKRIIEVTDNIQPSTYPDTFVSNSAPRYVLEVRAGHAAELGLFSGVKLHF